MNSAKIKVRPAALIALNVTLFPVAAFLLLLSGMGAPAQTAGQRETSAALMRVLFGTWDGVHPAAPTASPAPSRGMRQQTSLSPRTGKASAEGGTLQGAVKPVRPVLAVTVAFERKLYQTRFGFADGAYLAAGPPAVDPSNGHNWQLS